MIRTPQDVFMVHPLPDRLKLGKNNTQAHVIHRRSLSPAHAQSLAQALENEKRSDSWCGVEGINRDHGFLFLPSALAALFLSLALPVSRFPRLPSHAEFFPRGIQAMYSLPSFTTVVWLSFIIMK